MPIQIRKARVSDFEQIYDLIKEFAIFIKTPEKLSITLPQMIKEKDFFRCLIALDNDIVVGFASYFFAYYSWSGKAMYLDDLYVLEKYRGQGIGNQLLDQVIATARKENCKKLRWQVSNWNTKAIEFYKKRGAMIDDVEINCDLILG